MQNRTTQGLPGYLAPGTRIRLFDQVPMNSEAFFAVIVRLTFFDFPDNLANFR
jgi:hypothetical protein